MEFEPQPVPSQRQAVNQALKIDDVFEEEPRVPTLLIVPIVLLVLFALDNFSLMFNSAFGDRFLRGDATWALLGGMSFGSLLLATAWGLYRLRRWALWLGLGTLAAELLFAFVVYAGADLAVMAHMRTPIMNWMTSADAPTVAMSGADLGMSSGAAYLVRSVVMAILLLPALWTTE